RLRREARGEVRAHRALSGAPPSRAQRSAARPAGRARRPARRLHRLAPDPDGGPDVDRPLWRIVLPILLLSFAAHRAGAAAIAWSAVPRALALASGAEAAAALLAALGLFFGGRPATVGVAAFGVVVAAHALLL